MNENDSVKTNMNDSTNSVMVCPVCGETFKSIHEYARHLSRHSEEQKKREAEEEKQRKADQKKVDTARLEKLKKIYEDASSNYIKAKEKYIKDYNESPDTWDDILSILHKHVNNNPWNNWW